MSQSRDAFVERIASLATHEIMNGLATIKESGGLMRDLVAVGAVGPGASAEGASPGLLGRLLGRAPVPPADKAMAALTRSLDKNARGVERVHEIALALNRFLHGFTPPATPLPCRDAAHTMAMLLGPTARKLRRKIELVEPFPDSGLAGFAPLPLYQALAEEIETALAASDTTTTYLHCTAADAGPVFVVSTLPALPDSTNLADLTIQAVRNDDGVGRAALPHGAAILPPR